MSSVVIAGDTSGSVTLQAPAVAGATVLTLPTTSGTLALTSGTTIGNTQVAYGNSSGQLIGSAGLVYNGTSFNINNGNTVAYLNVNSGATGGTAAYFGATDANITGLSIFNQPANFRTLIASQWNSTGTALALGLANSEYMRVHTNGFIGINTTSPSNLLTVYSSNSSNAAIVSASDDGSGNSLGVIATYATTAPQTNPRAVLGLTGYVGYLKLYDGGNTLQTNLSANGTSYMAATNLVIGGTTNSSVTSKLYVTSSNFVVSINGTNTSGEAVRFYSNGTTVGTISYTGSATAYNTSSDKRLKTLIGVSTDISVIDKTVVNDFTWKADGTADRGVFAQDAYLVKPSAVKVGDNETEITDPWGVDYSKYVPDLIVYCQQLKARVEALEAQLGAK